MSEWWTYHLSDFLLFSARTYDRLFEIYNAAIWPAQILAIALGVAILVLLRRGDAAPSRRIAVVLAASWLWIGVAFLARRYAAINWSAAYFAWAFALEAALLLWFGMRGLLFDRPTGLATRVGLSIFLIALFIQPWIGPLLGRSWKGAELFALCPDPTAVGTLGLLLLARARRRWSLMIVPILWCLYTGIFLLAMKAPDFWIAPVVAGVAAFLGFFRHRGAWRE